MTAMKKRISIAAISRLIWILTILTILEACKKDKDTPSPDQQNNQLIRAWKMDSVTLNDQPYPGHEFDNWEFEFQKEGKYVLSDGTNSNQGQWELSSGNQLILDKGTTNELLFTILKLDQSNLALQTTQTSTKTGEVKIVFQLSPK